MRYRLPIWIVAGCLAAIELHGQPVAPFTLQLTDSYIETDFDMDRQDQRIGQSREKVLMERFVLQPLLGLGVGGSVYHPKLVGYHFNAELGLTWQDTRQRPGRQASTTDLLQRYHAALEILKEKPYATTLFADRDEIYRDYDLYSRVRVNTDRYGFQTGFRAAPVQLSIGGTHLEEREADLRRPTSSSEDTLTANAHNQRRGDAGSTDLNYTLSQFTRTDNGYSKQTGLRQSVNLFDLERFGTRRWMQLSSSLAYYSLEKTVSPNDSFSVDENLSLEHSPRLSTTYQYGFNTISAGPSDSESHHAQAAVAHRLFDNLTSRTTSTAIPAQAPPPATVPTTRAGMAWG